MKIASQILKKMITVTFDSSLLLFPVQCKACKTFAFKDKLKWKKQQQASLAIAKQFLKQGQSSKELLKSISSKWKLINVEKNIRKLEEKVATLGNQQDYTFDILLKSWMPFTFL